MKFIILCNTYFYYTCSIYYSTNHHDYIDYTINVTELNFNLKTIIKNSITITTSFIPCLISNINNIICASSDDYSFHTIEFNINKKESREIVHHEKNDDHTDIIRAICPIRRLELFVTVSQDKSLKIWDYDNCLVKDILFQDSMCAICCIDNTLDLLIGISDRIDILKATDCKFFFFFILYYNYIKYFFYIIQFIYIMFFFFFLLFIL